jgi:hypothetical protein
MGVLPEASRQSTTTSDDNETSWQDPKFDFNYSQKGAFGNIRLPWKSFKSSVENVGA